MATGVKKRTAHSSEPAELLHTPVYSTTLYSTLTELFQEKKNSTGNLLFNADLRQLVYSRQWVFYTGCSKMVEYQIQEMFFVTLIFGSALDQLSMTIPNQSQMINSEVMAISLKYDHSESLPFR